MAKHTKGPWEWVEHSSSVTTVGNTAELAQCHGPKRFANARLMAASPELLAACRLALTWVYDQGRRA